MPALPLSELGESLYCSLPLSFPFWTSGTVTAFLGKVCCSEVPHGFGAVPWPPAQSLSFTSASLPRQLVQMLCALSQTLLLMLFKVLPHRYLLHAPHKVPLMEQALCGPGEPSQGRCDHFPSATSPLCPGMGEMVLQGEGCGGAWLGAGVVLR